MKTKDKKKLIIGIVVAIILVASVGIGALLLNNKPKEPEVTEKKPPKKEESIATKYAKIGTLNFAVDEAPIAINNEGYIIKVDGKYGFINANQEVIIEPQYTNLQNYGFEKNGKEDLCFLMEYGQSSTDINGQSCAGGIGGTSPYKYVWDTTLDESVIIYQGNEAEPLATYDGKFGELDSTTFAGYYFFNAVANPLQNFDGPVPDGYNVYIVKDGVEKVDPVLYDQAKILRPRINNTYTLTSIRKISQLNAIRQGDKWAIIDENLTKLSSFEYENIMSRSNTSIYVEKEGMKGMLDGTGKLTLIGAFDDLSAPIDGKAFVKTNEGWIQIQIQE